MGGGGDAGEALEEGLSWGVEVLVGDAEDAAGSNGLEVMPVALGDDAFEGDTVPCSAPGEKEDVGVGGGDGFRSGVSPWPSQILASGGFDEFGYPGLGMDEGVAPFLTVDHGRLRAPGAPLSRGCDGGLHLGNDGFGFRLSVDVGGDEADVFIDVGERMRSEGQDGKAGFEDRGEGFHPVRNAGDDEIGLRCEDLFGVGGPTVVQDGEISCFECRKCFEAVFCAGAQVVEAIERGERESDRGLQRGYPHVESSIALRLRVCVDRLHAAVDAKERVLCCCSTPSTTLPTRFAI